MGIAESLLDTGTARRIYDTCGWDPLGQFEGSHEHETAHEHGEENRRELEREHRALTEELQKKYPSPHR